jgi:tetratricopeptide (TPR) repeat protein
MEDAVAVELRRIVLRYGPEIGDDARRVDALLRDMAGAYRREIYVLAGAAREGVPAQLMSSQGTVPAAVLAERLARALQDNLGLGEEAARWAVATWASALAGIDTAGPPSSDAQGLPSPSVSVSSVPSPPVPSATALSEAEVANRLLALPLDEVGDVAWAVLGLLAVADGPMTMADAAGVLRQPVRQVHRAIAPIADLIVRDGRLEASSAAIRRAVTGYLDPAEQQSQRQALVRWCAECATSRQPGHDTPEYILRHGADCLAAAGDLDALSRIVDREWMRQSAARTGSLTTFIRDMSRIADTAVAQRPPDRHIELRASLAGVTAASIAADVPPEALGVLAAAGQAERALDLAASVGSWSRSDAYYRIATALHAADAVEAGDAAADKAIAAAVSDARESGVVYTLSNLVSSMHKSGMVTWASRAVAAFQAEGLSDQHGDSVAVEVLAATGDVDGAWRIARRIDPSFWRDSALETVVIALARAGRIQDAIETARDVQSNAGALTGKIAAITAERGDVKATMTVIESAPDGNVRQWVVTGAGKVLARAGRVDDIAAILKTLPNAENQRHAGRAVATALAESGRISRAVSIWTAVADEQNKERVVVELVKAAAEASDIDGALRTASALNDDYQRRKALAHIAGAVARSGDLPRARDIVGTMEDGYDRNSVLAEVSKDLTAHDRFDDAVAVADMITSPSAKAESQVAVASALLAAGDYSRSAALASEAVTASSKGGSVSVRALLTQARALALSDRTVEAAAVAEQAEGAARATGDEGLLADALATRSAVLSTWSGHEDEAAADARNVTALIREDVSAGSDAAYWRQRWAESVAAIFAEAGPPDLAIEAAWSAGDGYDRTRVFTAVAAALARRGLADQAIEAARNASTYSYEAEDKLKEVARILARHGDGDGALRAIAALADVEGVRVHIEYDQADMVREVVRTLAESGRVEAACATARSSVPSGNRSSALTEVACVVAAAGDPRLAAEIAETAGVHGLAKVADALAASGRIGDALLLADDAIQRVLAAAPAGPDTAAALDSLVQFADASGPASQAATGPDPAGEMTAAWSEAAARQAVRQAQAITDPVRRAKAMVGAAMGLAGTSNPELKAEAVALAEQVRQDARRLEDRIECVNLLGRVAQTFAGCGEPEMAAETARECLAARAANPSLYGSYGAQLAMGALVDIGQAADALSGIGSLEVDAFKVQALHDIAVKLARNGQAGDLLTLIDETGVLDLITDNQGRISALADLGVVIARAGDATAADELAERAATLAGEASGDREKALAQADMAELLAALGRRSEAVEQARRALAAPREALGAWRGQIASKAAQVLVQSDQVAEALAVVKTAPAMRRAESVVTVAAALVDTGQQDRAIELVEDEFAAVRVAGRRDTFYDLTCEHLPRYPDVFRAWLGDGTEIAQISAELAAIEQWWE